MNAPLGFRCLAARLTRYLNELVRRGEISERGLARLSGYSQPHIHNVLKGARKMNLELADQIMELLGIPLLSLFTQKELSGLAPPRRGEAAGQRAHFLGDLDPSPGLPDAQILLPGSRPPGPPARVFR